MGQDQDQHRGAESEEEATILPDRVIIDGELIPRKEEGKGKEDDDEGSQALEMRTTALSTSTLKVMMSEVSLLDDREEEEAAAPSPAAAAAAADRSRESKGDSSSTTTTTTTPPTPPPRPFQFGQRYLSASDDVFAHNAWDHVMPDASHERYAESRYREQRQQPVSAKERARIEASPARWWDLFYRQKATSFFKDRSWLRQEFPVLETVTRAGAGDRVVLEVGAGAGNTAFPIVRANRNDRLRVHAVDFSPRAVHTIRASPHYDPAFITADVWDVASPAPAPSPSQPQPQPQPQREKPQEHGETAGGEPSSSPSSSLPSLPSLPPGLTQDSVDVVVMIFVFSALSPDQWSHAVRNIYHVLKPGGEVLFRDYGRGDLAQVRFKAGRWMEENFYLRGDGTRVYFFDKEELARIWAGGGGGDGARGDGGDGGGGDGARGDGGDGGGGGGAAAALTEETPRFDILDLDVDRRLIVNRQKRIKMYRCWIQGRFKKPPPPPPTTTTTPGTEIQQTDL